MSEKCFACLQEIVVAALQLPSDRVTSDVPFVTGLFGLAAQCTAQGWMTPKIGTTALTEAGINFA